MRISYILNNLVKILFKEYIFLPIIFNQLLFCKQLTTYLDLYLRHKTGKWIHEITHLHSVAKLKIKCIQIFKNKNTKYLKSAFFSPTFMHHISTQNNQQINRK